MVSIHHDFLYGGKVNDICKKNCVCSSIETAGLQVYGGFYNAAHRSFDITSFITILITSMVTTVLASRWR
jgi:hypothetical protein